MENKPNNLGFKIKDFFIKTTNGMALGLFATLIIGTIISTLALAFNFDATIGVYSALNGLAKVLQYATGFGIGLGVAFSLKLDGMKLISGALCGFIAAYCAKGSDGFDYSNVYDFFAFKIGDPLTIYLVVIMTLLLSKFIFARKTPVDIVIIPLGMSLIAFGVTLLINQPVYLVTTAIRQMFAAISNLDNLALAMLAGSLISAVMGICLTLPISSAALAIIFNIDKVAGAAALIGCCCQMVGFAVQSYRDNGIAKSISVGIGTSMLQFKNIIRKPIIWLPTIIASLILGPFAALFNFQTDASGAGMGTCALVGQIATINGMSAVGAPWINTLLFILLFQLLLPFGLVFGLDSLFRKVGLIKKGDLTL